jgi:rhodanese-related sulfurtransferase
VRATLIRAAGRCDFQRGDASQREMEELDEESSRIAGAQSIPLSELASRAGEVPKDRPVIAFCHAGMRSGQATVILRQEGFQRVANLHGGMLSWEELGLPTARRPPHPPDP